MPLGSHRDLEHFWVCPLKFIKTIMKWFEEAALEKFDITYGYNGIVGRGKVPLKNF